MASAEQIQAMLDMMAKQMERMDTLQAENSMLREQANAVPQAGSKKRPTRPLIEANISDCDWALFEDSWKRYKAMAALTREDEIRMELRAACSSDVNKLLFEFVGPEVLDNASESQLMAHIKGIAVKGLHKEVHRMNFSKIKQGDGESVTHYVARLKSQASLCLFSVACSCHQNVSYAEEMVAQQLVTGLRDQEHQSKILSEATTLTSLQAKVERLQGLEATDESATKLHVPSAHTVAGAMKSSYKRAGEANRKPPTEPPTPQTKKCSTCGRTSHYGRTMSLKDCPAYKKNCNSCGKEGHFATVCKNAKTKASVSREDVVEDDTDTTAASTSYFFATSSVETGNGEEQDFRLRLDKVTDG